MSRILLPLLLLLALLAISASCTGNQQPQPPFNAPELDKFLKDAFEIDLYSKNLRLNMDNPLSDESAYQLKRATYAKIQEHGWDVRRFYYILLQCKEMYQLGQNQKATDLFRKQIEKQRSKGRSNDDMGKELKRRTMMVDIMRKEAEAKVPVSEQVLIHERLDTIKTFLGNTAIYFIPDGM